MPQSVVDTLESTVDLEAAWEGDSAGDPRLRDRDCTSDGFPVEDDLAMSQLGQYQLGPILGRGSMGRVYRGEHLGLGRLCAIKVMNPGLLARTPQIRERFWEEARSIAAVSHPNIVTVHNLGSDRGYHFIEMEYVAGGVSLSDQVIKLGAFEQVRASQIVRRVALALASAHQAGLVHRDVKPSNVLMTPEGQPKLADFGLVHEFRKNARRKATLSGTPNFMAPELFRGAAACPRSDLYALGVMYFYLLSGRLPFVADQLPQLVRMHVQKSVPDIRRIDPAISDEIAAILHKALAKTPNERFASGEEFAEALQVAIHHLRHPDDLIRESVQGLDCLVQGGGDRYRIICRVPGDRVQEVYIEVDRGRERERLLQIYSLCSLASPNHFEFALRLNSELTYGGLSVRDIDGQPMFVMTRTYSLGHVSAADVRIAIQEIARRSDWVESQLTVGDVF